MIHQHELIFSYTYLKWNDWIDLLCDSCSTWHIKYQVKERENQIEPFNNMIYRCVTAFKHLSSNEQTNKQSNKNRIMFSERLTYRFNSIDNSHLSIRRTDSPWIIKRMSLRWSTCLRLFLSLSLIPLYERQIVKSYRKINQLWLRFKTLCPTYQIKINRNLRKRTKKIRRHSEKAIKLFILSLGWTKLKCLWSSNTRLDHINSNDNLDIVTAQLIGFDNEVCDLCMIIELVIMRAKEVIMHSMDVYLLGMSLHT